MPFHEETPTLLWIIAFNFQDLFCIDIFLVQHCRREDIRVIVTGRQRQRRKKLQDDLKERGVLDTEIGNTRRHCIENWLWKRLWTCGLNDDIIDCDRAYDNIFIQILFSRLFFLCYVCS
jgi:hypothetical protein